MKRTLIVLSIATLALVAAAVQQTSSDPAVLLGAPNGMDPFDTKVNWTLFDNQCFKSEITGGKYLMTAKGMQGTPCWELTWPKADNGYLEATVDMPSVCYGEDRFGFIYRSPDNSRGYLYAINCQGQYTLTSWDGTRTNLIVPLTKSDLIKTGTGVSNRLGVAAFGDHHYLYVNGEFLEEATDALFLDPGKFGFHVRAARERPFTVTFDDLKVWVLEEEFFPPGTGASYPGEGGLEPGTGIQASAKTSLNIRAGPGTLFPVLTQVVEGTTGEVLGISPDGYWLAVKVPTSLYGSGMAWTSARYADISNPDNIEIPVVEPPLLPPGIYTIPPAPGQAQVTMVSPGVIRSGPSGEYTVYGVSPIGSVAAVIGKSKDGNWWAISLPRDVASDGTGWVYKTYVSAKNVINVPELTPPPPAGAVTPSAPATKAPAVVALENVDVRTGPGGAYPSLGKATKGTVMAVIGKSADDQYYVIQLPRDLASTGQGWVAAAVVEAKNVKRVPVFQPPPKP
ncbi:MAG TPA: SH3 domain-containing protein [Anaerolineales bacterium]|nr:SH3 domain-containing protein [Anaerolineales bacterium]